MNCPYGKLLLRHLYNANAVIELTLKITKTDNF